MAPRVEPPILVIVGPTASGKTRLAVQLAQNLKGEIICADSRTIYKGADVGTAKPTLAERQGIPHWGLDLVSVDQRYSVANFQEYAEQKIGEIRTRGNVPIMVGGTGLYIDSVLFDFRFRGQRGEWRRNLRRDTFVVGMATSRQTLKQRIVERSEQLFNNGVVKEATYLSEQYGWSAPGMTGNIYRVARSYLEGDLLLSEAKDRFTTLDWQLAKRQMTWLRPNPYIEWCRLDDAYTYCMQLFASE